MTTPELDSASLKRSKDSHSNAACARSALKTKSHAHSLTNLYICKGQRYFCRFPPTSNRQPLRCVENHLIMPPQSFKEIARNVEVRRALRGQRCFFYDIADGTDAINSVEQSLF